MSKKRSKPCTVSVLLCISLFSAFFTVRGTTVFLNYVGLGSETVLYYDGKTLAEVITDETEKMIHCRLHELEEPSDSVDIIRNSGLKVYYPSFQKMIQLINNCTQLEKPLYNSTEVSNANLMEQIAVQWTSWSLIHGIFPGTKWCGSGDIAESFEELGSQSELDACCRAHDYCPVKLKSFRSGYGLFNFALYTKSHCDCDKLFYSCLKSLTSRIADVVGNLYFNVMDIQCLREHRPLVCVENRTDTLGSQSCLRWGPDPDSKKMHVANIHLRY